MKTLTSYTITRGSDGTQSKVINWQESEFYIGFVEGEVRFYKQFKVYHKVYIPKAGEHLEITGDSAEWDAAEYEYFKQRLRVIGGI